jgi:hypothetical protein
LADRSAPDIAALIRATLFDSTVKQPPVIASQRVRAKRGPMTGSAKQSRDRATTKLDCFRLRARALRRTPTRRSSRSERRRVVAVAPRNDADEGRAQIAAARAAPELLQETLESRGRRECQVLDRTCSLVCNKESTRAVTTGQAAITGIPCAMVLTLLRALPGVRDLIVTVAWRSST